MTPTEPRLSATVLLVRDDPFAVLMVRRVAKHNDQFSSALVFPGGVVDPEDRAETWRDHLDGADGFSAEERALRIAAARETFEETGILLAEGRTAGAVRDGRNFRDMVAVAGLTLPLPDFVHFAHWITPEPIPRRFDTHFYLCRAPDGAEAVCDGREIVAVEWVSPAEAVAGFGDPARRMVFPTRLNLMRLAESRDVAGAFAAARARPRFTVLPQPARRDGHATVVIPAEAGYGVTEDWLPRD